MPATLPENARCVHCDYLLRGLSENKCPECGREFDPADPATYRLPDISYWTYRWAQSPSRRLFPIVFGILLLYVFYAPPSREAERCLLVFTIAFLAALTIDTLLRRLARRAILAASPEFADPLRYRKSDRAALTSIVWLMCIAIGAGLIFEFNLPIWAGFQLSRPFLKREITKIRETLPVGAPGFYPIERRIGVYYVHAIRVDPGNNFTFWTNGPIIVYVASATIPDSIWLGPEWRISVPWGR